MIQMINNRIGFFNASPVLRQTAPPLANNLASAVTAINLLRQSLLNYGLLQ